MSLSAIQSQQKRVPQHHGLLLVRKPSGISSHDLVQKVRRSLSIKEVGHAGTLDPLAEGLMVLLLGEATKLSSFVLEENKQYEVTLLTGKETDTLDITGTVTKENVMSIDDHQIIEAGLTLQGEFFWEVPLYSATKVEGRKLYEYAREGVSEVKAPLKTMSFWGNEYLGKFSGHQFRFRLNCSKGSFIRTWVEQLGKRLGCGAVMTELTRTISNPYLLSQAVSLDKIIEHNKSLLNPEIIKEATYFIPLLKTLPKSKIIRVNGLTEVLIRNGQISHELKIRLIVAFDPEKDQLVKILSHRPEELVALIGFDPEKGFVVRRVFRY